MTRRDTRSEALGASGEEAAEARAPAPEIYPRAALPPPGEALWERLRAASARALVLDYDGTLAPFQVDRGRALPAKGVVAALRRAVAAAVCEVIVVSGRPVDEVRGFLPGIDIEVFGAHGWERRAKGGKVERRPLEAAQERALAGAVSRLRRIRPALTIERKHASVAVHLRGLPAARARACELRARRILDGIAARVTSVEVRGFDGGVELRARGADKGTAIGAILDRLGGDAFAIYLGDDLTDEDAFLALQGRGAGILVLPNDRPTAAIYRVDGPREAVEVIERVASIGRPEARAQGRAPLEPWRRDGRLVVVSNRLPEASAWSARGGRAATVGGLVSALKPALERAGRALWLGWSGRGVRAGEACRATRSRVAPGIDVVAVDLSEADVDGHYNGFCNKVLWPIFHSFSGRATYDAGEHASFERVNALFARELVRRLRPEDRVWVHDYQLLPLGRELRRRGFEGPLGFFLHIPFPPSDIFAILPCSRPLAHALAAYDLVGFHTQGSVANYERTLHEEAGAVPLGGGRIEHGGRIQRAAAYPIGIDPATHRAWAEEEATRRRARAIRLGVRQRKIVLGVDRLDYTKGIPDRLKAFARLLEIAPRLRKRVSMIQISAPSRTRVAEYARQRREVEELVGNVNGRFGSADWVPVRYLYRSFGQRELAAFYREADVCLVSPLRDGMNLVAKEFVVSQGAADPGVLVLSRFAGAAEELREALIVNPYDVDGTARALAAALSMPLEERRRRQEALEARVLSTTAADWAERFDRDLAAAREP